MNDDGRNLSISDAELVQKIKAGDTDAFTRVYNRYWDSLYKKAYKRLKDRSASKDAVQNVFIDLWKRRKTSNIANLKSYLYGAVRFQVFKQIDKTKKFESFFEPFEDMMVAPFWTDGNIIRNELEDLLSSWVAALPRKRRKIFMLHYQEQLSASEIASRLNLSRKTVYNQLGSSIKELKLKLAQFMGFLLLILSCFFLT